MLTGDGDWTRSPLGNSPGAKLRDRRLHGGLLHSDRPCPLTAERLAPLDPEFGTIPRWAIDFHKYVTILNKVVANKYIYDYRTLLHRCHVRCCFGNRVDRARWWQNLYSEANVPRGDSCHDLRSLSWPRIDFPPFSSDAPISGALRLGFLLGHCIVSSPCRHQPKR